MCVCGGGGGGGYGGRVASGECTCQIILIADYVCITKDAKTLIPTN